HRAVQARDDESLVFSWVEWPDKATRDAAHAAMPERMKSDERMNPERNPMPFDGMRMIYGGFTPVVTLERPACNKPGDYIWYELLTTDLGAAQQFYSRVLDWKFVDSGQAHVNYQIVMAGENGVGGMMQITAEMANHGTRPTWLGYLAV